MRDLAELLEQFRQEGFDRSFDGEFDHLSSAREPSDQNAGSVRLVDVVQLDAGTDPGDEVTVFLLETDSGVRGYLLVPDSFHTDPGKARFVDELMASKRTARDQLRVSYIREKPQHGAFKFAKDSKMSDREILILYDAKCPVCDFYCRLVRIRASVGNLKLVDARESTAVMEEITRAGLDIDQGMVLKIGDELYYGSDAIHALALISSRSGLLNRLNYWVFRSRALSRLIYPLLRFFRNMLLKTHRKTRINNLRLDSNDRF